MIIWHEKKKPFNFLVFFPFHLMFPPKLKLFREARPWVEALDLYYGFKFGP